MLKRVGGQDDHNIAELDSFDADDHAAAVKKTVQVGSHES